MEKLVLALIGIAGLAGATLADDVAVLDIKFGPEKALRRVVIEFYENAAPRAVANFKKLASQGFYNGTAFHRVFPHLMLQAGDPLSAKRDREPIGTGGPGYNLPAEITKLRHEKGTVAAARLPDKINPAGVSNGSQFYITLAPMPNYDGQHTIFGHVTQGLELLDAVSELPTDTNDNPLERVEITSARIVPREAVNTLKPKDRRTFGFLPRLF